MGSLAHSVNILTDDLAENRVPSLVRRSGLPRLTANFPSVLHSRSHAGPDPSPSTEPFISHPSPLSRFQPLALKRVFSNQSSKERIQETTKGIGCTPRSSKSSCSSWISSFHSRSSPSPGWDIKSPEEREYSTETWRDETSTFSRQLAKITRGSNEDLWTSCRPCLSVPRPAWPADGSHSGVEERRITKECVGRKVLIGGKEEGILRYFGRTAFSSGHWCGIELDTEVGKNDGSVDGVIYFTCAPGHGIFAPDSKVSLLDYLEVGISMKSSKLGNNGSGSSNSNRNSTNTNNTLYRLSGASSSSSSSGLSGHSNDSKRSSGGSSATYTIVGRENDSLPSTPSDGKSRQFKDYTICETGGTSEPVSPETGTCDDSSLGILTPDQMADFTMTASASFERSPSDENVAALEDEVCDELGAVGGHIDRWDSHGSISGIEEEIIQRDISVIIRELKKKESDNGSSTSSSVHTTFVEDIKDIPENCLHRTDSSKTPIIKAKSLEKDANILLEKVRSDNKDIPLLNDKIIISTKNNISKQSYEKNTTCRISKLESEADISEWQSGVSNMTTSAASLDQGYQGDGEFDVPSEAGSATASSPTEDPQLFEGVIDVERMSLDPNSSAATEADVSLADDETESENGVIPRDRSARIIDGKLYHSHRELVALRHGEGRHDAHTSEMDSSGFYSDLDPRDEESTRMEVPSLQPLKESKLDNDLHDSVLEDITQGEDEMEEYATVTKPRDVSERDAINKEKNLTNEESSLIDEDDKSSTCTIRSELKDVSSSDNIPSVPSDSSISHNEPKVTQFKGDTNTNIEKHIINNTLSENNTDLNVNNQSLNENQTITDKESTIKPEDNTEIKNDSEDTIVPLKPRNYEKPWLSKPTSPRKVEKPKVLLPPPPPMPKKNVQSKLKALLEASEPSPEDRRPRQPKKGRWDEVMSRIEEGKKEEKVRPKVKEVRSRLMDALKAPPPVSPQVERIRQERRERRERRERQAVANAVVRRMSERKRSVASNRPSRAPSLDSIGVLTPHSIDSRSSTPEISQHSTSSNISESRAFISRTPSDVSMGSNQSQASTYKRPALPQPIRNIYNTSYSRCATSVGDSNSFGVRTPARERANRLPPPSRALSRVGAPTPGVLDDKKGPSSSSASSPAAALALARRAKIDTPKTAFAKHCRGASSSSSSAAATRTKQTDPVKILRPTSGSVGLNGHPPAGVGPPPSSSSSSSSHAHPPAWAEEHRKKLEAELVSRRQEAQTAKEDAARANRGVEALTVIVHYLTNEYDAFSTPQLKAEAQRLSSQLTDVRLCLDESVATARRLEDEARERHQKQADELLQLEQAHLEKTAAMTLQHQRETEEVLEKQKLELKDLSDKGQAEREDLLASHSEELSGIDWDWRSQMDRQHENHILALEQLNTCHTLQLRNAEAKWECREKEFQETNSQLLKEQRSLKAQAKNLEQTLLSDKDHRLQAAKRLCTAFQNEVDSLKTVVEMRNSEVHKLRDQLLDKERLSEELDAAREKVRALHAKTEDLHAQMEKKLQLERQLIAEHHSISDSLQREASINKRLSLDNEELQWKLRQREAASGSLPTSTLDLVTRCSSAIARQQEGCKNGVLSPQFTPRSQRIGTATRPHDKKWSQSFSNIPEDASKLLLRRTELQHDDVTLDESPPPSPRVKAVIEKSNSVSFILDLNDTFPDDPFLGIQSTPPHLAKKTLTPKLQRKSLRKTFSNNLEKSSSTSVLQRSSRSSFHRDFTSANGQDKSKLNGGGGDGGSENSEEGSAKAGGGGCLDLHASMSKYSRAHSTSESSDSGDVERISPTGLAWTVPVHSNAKRYSKHIPNRFHQMVSDPPRLLQQPDEDEYEEMENENEFVEVLTLAEDLSSAPLTTLFAQTPSTSVSLSDSDVSQCGSRVDLSTEDEDDEGTDDEGTLLQKESRPQEGAGEAMIFPDVFDLKGDGKGVARLKEISKSQISSAPSSDSEDAAANQPMNEEGPLNMSWSEDVECDLTSSSEMQELL